MKVARPEPAGPVASIHSLLVQAYTPYFTN
jgi:hypothetical protein